MKVGEEKSKLKELLVGVKQSDNIALIFFIILYQAVSTTLDKNGTLQHLISEDMR